MRKQPKIHILTLSYNIFSTVGCKAISKLFYQDSEILTLDLTHNRIGTECFRDILHSLRKNLRTRKLYLNECEISKYKTPLIFLNNIIELDYDQDILDSMKRNCTLILLSLGGNQINDKLLEDIETELSSNRGISDLILPMVKDQENVFQGHKLSLAGKGIANLDFLAKFIRENPQITGMNVEMDDFQEHEVRKITDALKGNTSMANICSYL